MKTQMNKKITGVILGAIFSISVTTAQAVQVASFATTFSGSETLWQGSGIPTTGFDESFSTGGAVGIKGRAVANTGTAAATVRGSISATYEEHIGSSGATSVKLNFSGSNSNVSSDFGASASLDAFVDAGVLDVEFGLAGVGAFLEPSRNFTSNLGNNSGNGSDQEEVGSVGSLDVFIGRLGASVDLDFRQTISLRPNTIDGILAGVNRDTGSTIATSFLMGSSDMTDVNLTGLDQGLWDFSILDLDLLSTFYNTASLVLEPTINYIIGDWSLASFNVPLITNTFTLDLDASDNRNLFSILVTPIPAAAWLFGTALIGLIGMARKRKTVQAS